MEIDETISIVPYDQEWPRLFEKERDILLQILGDKIIELQHIGSTAVVGLWGKPIIDMIGRVTNYPVDSEVIKALEAKGYESLGESGVRGRQYLRKRGNESYNLHIVKNGNEHWRKNLLFRDYLRFNEKEAEMYSHHKRELMTEGINRLLDYSNRKAQLIAEIIERAEIWKNKQID